jgi:hypothetical protein
MSFKLATVRVGKPDATVDVSVYRDLLSSVPPYFRGAFECGFKEATYGAVPLTDVTEETFRIFLQWVHAQLHSSASDVSIPDHSLLTRTASTAKSDTVVLVESLANIHNANEDESGNEEDESSNDGDESDNDNDPDDPSINIRRSAFDEAGYKICATSDDERDKLYYMDDCWVKSYQMSFVSYLNLYIFADKYSVRQLRADILTAMLG